MSERLRLPREMEANLVRYQAPFMQEDTWADLIKSFLEEYEGDAVYCQMLYREALDMYGMPNRMETSQIMEIMSGIAGWCRFQNPRRFKNYRRQKGWERVATKGLKVILIESTRRTFRRKTLRNRPWKGNGECWDD